MIGFGPKKVAESKEEKSSKKRKRDDDDDEEDDEDDEDAVVNVDFQFFDPREVDHYTVKIMLRNYLGKGWIVRVLTGQ